MQLYLNGPIVTRARPLLPKRQRNHAGIQITTCVGWVSGRVWGLGGGWVGGFGGSPVKELLQVTVRWSSPLIWIKQKRESTSN